VDIAALDGVGLDEAGCDMGAVVRSFESLSEWVCTWAPRDNPPTQKGGYRRATWHHRRSGEVFT